MNALRGFLTWPLGSPLFPLTDVSIRGWSGIAGMLCDDNKLKYDNDTSLGHEKEINQDICLKDKEVWHAGCKKGIQ